MEGPYLVKSLWSKLWNCAKRGCRNPGHEHMRLFGEGMMKPGLSEHLLRSKWHWSYPISYSIAYPTFKTWPSISYVILIFDIEYDIGIQYRCLFIRIIRHQSFETAISVTLNIDLRCRSLLPLISDIFDIEVTKHRYRRCIWYRSLRYRFGQVGHYRLSGDRGAICN